MKRAALEKLIEAVEAGEAPITVLNFSVEAWPPESAGGHCTFHKVGAAFDGSLDAAKALHEVVLPGWSLDQFGERAGGWIATLGRYDGKTQPPAPSAMVRDNPARAWLLAILRALHAEVA